MAVPAVGGRQLRGQVASKGVVRERERHGRSPIAGADRFQQLVRDGHQRRALLDGKALERERVGRLREAVLVRRSSEALQVVDVVDDRHAVGEELQRDRRQGVRQVVAVNEVGPKLVADRSQDACLAPAEVPPALEELVTGPVPVAQRLALVGEAEPDPREGRAQCDRVLERPHTRLLLEEEDAHQRLLIRAGGVADGDGVRLELTHDHASAPDDAPVTESRARNDADAHPDPAVGADLDGPLRPALVDDRPVPGRSRDWPCGSWSTGR